DRREGADDDLAAEDLPVVLRRLVALLPVGPRDLLPRREDLGLALHVALDVLLLLVLGDVDRARLHVEELELGPVVAPRLAEVEVAEAQVLEDIDHLRLDRVLAVLHVVLIADVERDLVDGELQALAVLLEGVLLDRRVEDELDLVLPGEEDLVLPRPELGDVLAGADGRDALLHLRVLEEEDEDDLDAVLERAVALDVDRELRVLTLDGGLDGRGDGRLGARDRGESAEARGERDPDDA